MAVTLTAFFSLLSGLIRQPDAEPWESITPSDGTCHFGEEFRGAAGLFSETSECSIWPACSQGLPASLRGVYLTMNFNYGNSTCFLLKITCNSY